MRQDLNLKAPDPEAVTIEVTAECRARRERGQRPDSSSPRQRRGFEAIEVKRYLTLVG